MEHIHATLVGLLVHNVLELVAVGMACYPVGCVDILQDSLATGILDNVDLRTLGLGPVEELVPGAARSIWLSSGHMRAGHALGCLDGMPARTARSD